MNDMHDPRNLSQEYLRNTVLTATPEQLQLMLYDGAIRFAARGLEALCAKNREVAFEALDRAQRIVLELENGLRPDVNPTLAEQMAALYGFVYRRLVHANLHQDPHAVEEALKILRHQRETWSLLIERIRKESPAPAAAATRQPSAARSDPTSAEVPSSSSFVAEG